MKKFRFIDDLIAEKANPCAIDGCACAGEHRAPLSKHQLEEHQWLCSDHIVEFNKKWDYFDGMSQPEIERFQKEATFGHRPTWKTNEAERHATEKLQAAFGKFMGESFVFSGPEDTSISRKDRIALSELDLTHPCTKDDIKTQYKKLVKKFHPDRNQGNKKAEERFKQITASYHYLIQHYCEPISKAC